MGTRVAIIGIIVECTDCVETINQILHEYSQYIIGRMGLPYRQRDIGVISIVLDAPQNVTSALSGKLGKLPGVGVSTIYAKHGEANA